jgi:DNA repair photolyase
MGRLSYIGTPCKMALNRVSGMPFRWSLNPYRGCTHRCHYCYARASHTYLGMNADEDFETKIIVKSNMPEVLRQELGRRSWTRERVAIGTATDAYQPCEGRYRLTRRCLQALRDAETPVSIVTKSTLILRDLELLTDLAQGSGATVYFTITTLDPELWRLIEPGTPPPAQRLTVMRRLTDAGVPCGVFLAPILPGITDSIDSMDAVAAAAKELGAASFGSAVLRLAPLVKEHYLGFVAETFPELLPRYERAYTGTNISSDYQVAIERRLARIRERHGFVEDAMRGRRKEAVASMRTTQSAMAQMGQLALPL